MDIFDATTILCKKCKKEMQKVIVDRNGLQLRAIKCPKCGDKIVHPADLNNSEKFNNLRGKQFSVKLRMVGNSHTVSIPKEIVNFMNAANAQHNQMKRQMDAMVNLCLEDFKRLSLNFGPSSLEEDERAKRDKEMKRRMEHA